MRTDKETALKLRFEGKSYREIRKALGVPLATLSAWLKDDPQSILIFETLKEKHKGLSREKIAKMNEARRGILALGYKEAEEQAKKEFHLHHYKPIFIAGLSIYWSEGDRTSKYNIRVTNADPQMIAIFKDFLAVICNVEESRIKSWLLLYPDLEEENCKRFWIASAGLKSANFTKSIIIQGRHKTKRVPFGICTIGISSRLLKIKIKTWISCMARDLLAKKAGMV